MHCPFDCTHHENNLSWWPPIIERHPALIAAFTAVAKAKHSFDGIVKVNACEFTIGGHVLKLNAVDLLVPTHGLQFLNLPHDNIESAVSLILKSPAILSNSCDSEFQKLKENCSKMKLTTILVCNHMSRDERCGVIGTQLLKKFNDYIKVKNLDEKVQVLQVSHIGGHKYAGNVIVYGGIHPCDGDWFGGINKDNAIMFLDTLFCMTIDDDGGHANAYLRKFWRGNFSFTKQEQMEQFEEHGKQQQSH